MALHKQIEGILTKEFYLKHYVADRKSSIAIQKMLKEQGVWVNISTITRYANKFGVLRNASEARRNVDPNPLDFNVSFLNETMIEWIDGLMLGDGGISANSSKLCRSARAYCNLAEKEFAQYCNLGLMCYRPVVGEFERESMSSGILYAARTKFHPDLHIQYERWYKIQPDGTRMKTVPQDVRITPESVMLWYLGDGSVVESKTNSIALKISTDGFKEECVELLAIKLQQKGIACHRNGDNRIWINAKGIPAFFDFIGRKSPIQCYSYKFDLPEWRFESKRMSDVADELGLDYQKLAYWVKIGRVPCYRASGKGRPRMLPDHIEKVKQVMIEEGLSIISS